MVIADANKVLRLRDMCQGIERTRPYVRRQEVILKAWGVCKAYYVDGAVYLFPLKHAKKCILITYTDFCKAEDNGGIVQAATSARTLYDAYHLAIECGRDGIVVCLSPNNLPYVHGAIAWRITVDRAGFNGTIRRFCPLTGVSFREGEWRRHALAPWIGCQVWSRPCQGVELV